MKPEELRIGNYVKFVTDRSTWMIGKVKAINPNKVTVDNYNIKYCNISPIELTDKLLLKCGFEKILGGIGWDKFIKDGVELSFAPLVGGGYIPVYSFNYDYIKIRFLHQLQNLFWCLSGKELEINL